MEQQQQQQPPPSPSPPPPRQASGSQLHQPNSSNPSQTSLLPLRTASSTPMSSPGMLSPQASRPNVSMHAASASETATPVAAPSSSTPSLHRRVRETHKALIDSHEVTGRKTINQYEVIEELGRGMHGKVKLARNTHTGENVAIKIIPRFSKKRRLGKVTARSPQDKTKKEIAILKKIRHDNVVALLEVIDDPELKKIYMVLEHVELGEIVWRKKGLPHICLYERHRIEREMRGEPPVPSEEERYAQLLEHRAAVKELRRAKMAAHAAGEHPWNPEQGAADDASPASHSRVPSRDDLANLDTAIGSMPSSLQASRCTSRAPSRTHSVRSMGNGLASAAAVDTEAPANEGRSDPEAPASLPSGHGSTTALDGTMYGPYMEDGFFRGRSPSMADSIMSHMSSIDFNPYSHDAFADDFSYVPCFTFDQARTTFRDTVLGLEYLHYQGVVHRDIKPANLLWTRDHHVKISDFGVSYFGRPIREGEPDDTVSESEAKDFDDDLELAKTVGTPAFFAPELCYAEMDKETPKVSEQIDVWSLGVTLYCLIFARIPFLAEDEFQMFKKIATEDVYIPRRRLRAVDPSTSPSATSLYKKHSIAPLRDDNELVYEDIDPVLHDLLRKMLVKNPERRMKLRDIKRHPWVVDDLQNPIEWIDDTDPARPSRGKKIQVDEKEMSAAVVPLSFFERATSLVKKVGVKIIPGLERGESRSSRRRATSSAASSAGDMPAHASSTPFHHRRKSIRGDDYFGSDSPAAEHPLTASMTASPAENVVYDPFATVLASEELPRPLHRSGSSATDKRSASGSRPLGQAFGRAPALAGAQTMPTTPYYDGAPDDPNMRRARDSAAEKDPSRSRSVDRALFANPDKHSAPKVGISAATAPGSFQRPRHPRPMKSVDLGKAFAGASQPSPLGLGARPGAGYQHGQPSSDPDMYHRQRTQVEERPLTAHRSENLMTASPQAMTPSDAFGSASLFSRGEMVPGHFTDPMGRRRSHHPVLREATPMHSHHGQPPGDEYPPPSREETLMTAQWSSSTSMADLGTPLTSPSEVTSPVSAYASANASAKGTSDHMAVFQSDPSLPALLSGSSSVSADLDFESTGHPSVVVGNCASLLQTTDSLTPPALAKEPTSFPLDSAFEDHAMVHGGAIPLGLPSATSAPAAHRSPTSSPTDADDGDDGDDSDSDEGLVMGGKKKKKGPLPSRATTRSADSTDTARTVSAAAEVGGQQQKLS